MKNLSYIQRLVEHVLLSLQVSVMVAAAGFSCVAVLFISGYACLTLTYGEEDEDVFHHHDSPQVVTITHMHKLMHHDKRLPLHDTQYFFKCVDKGGDCICYPGSLPKVIQWADSFICFCFKGPILYKPLIYHLRGTNTSNQIPERC